MAEGETVDLDFNLSRLSSADVEFGFTDQPTMDNSDEVLPTPADDYSLAPVSNTIVAVDDHRLGNFGPKTVEIEAQNRPSTQTLDETFELHGGLRQQLCR